MRTPSLLAVGFPRLSAKLFLPIAVCLLFISVGWVTAQTFTTLHSFTGGSDGANPYAGLILSGSTLYGTTSDGGTSGYGTVFAVNTDGTGFTTLHRFAGGSEGGNPFAGLILSGNTLYGTTSNANVGNGTVFAVNTDRTGFRTLHSFTGGGEGFDPHAGLILSGNTLYGTTRLGGTSNYGTVFAVNTDGTGFTTLHSFAGGTEGFDPIAGLILSGSTLYGTTSSGGTSLNGTVFAVSTDGTGFRTLHSFTGGGDGANPKAELILSGNTLYGTANFGGTSDVGTVFAVNTDGTDFRVLHNFSNGSDGATPIAGLILSGNTLYGTASSGGTSLYGTVFAVNTDGTGFRVLHNFTYGSDGATPVAELILSSNMLYGTAFGGGSSGDGTVFSLSTPPPPVITSPATATATQDQLFVYQIIATNTPTRYTATPLPAGMSFDDVAGILGGTPTSPGTTQIHLTARNSFGTGRKTLTLTVRPFPSSGPVIASGTSVTARTGQPFSFEVFTTGGSPTARLTATGLPPGLSADPATGVISGTPTRDGSFGVTLTVRDGALTTTSTLELTFTSDPAIPVITNRREAALTAGQFFTYTITAPSSNHSRTTFSLIGNLPLGLGLHGATISGTFNPGDQNGGALLGNVQTGSHNSSGSGTNPLSFFQAVPATAKNISTRLAVGTDDNVLIGGFIVTGNASKKVIVRAIGPELGVPPFNVPNALQDPTLELRDHTGAVIASNDNWMDAPNKQEIINNTLAPSDNRESAMIVTLAPNNGDPASLTGHYTAIVRGKNETTGVALVEVYDIGTASLDVSSNAQLGNISTRGLVQTGDNVMIGGFILKGLKGDMPATVIVRAIGPSLTQYNVPNALQDPTLELRDHTGAVIKSNDNWMNDPGAAQIQTNHLAPGDPREAATIVTLQPGNYTVIVRGENNTTGIALVEGYVIP